MSELWSSRQQCFDIEKLTPSYDNPQDIKILCDHWPCYYPSKKLKIRLIFDNYERLAYYYKNGTLLMSLRPLNTKKYLYTNPFCTRCGDIITTFLRSSYLYKGEYRSHEELRVEIERLNNEARIKLQQQKYTYNNSNGNGEIIFDYNNKAKHSFINLTRTTVCGADEFSESIATGNLVYQYEVNEIKGLVKVITEKEEYDTTIFKYWKPWKFTPTVNPDKYLFWSKLLPEIKDNVDKTCAICLGELLSNNTGYHYYDYDCEGSFKRNKYYLCKVKESVESISRLPCKHMFHEPCILQWIYQNPVCPLCRIHMPDHNVIATPFIHLPYPRLQDF